MNFTPENAKKVMAGTKTQTRRIVKDGEVQIFESKWQTPVYHNATDALGHRAPKWEVGETYAVCPGRGKPAIGRIRITAIRHERVQNISPDDCYAEGIRIYAGDPQHGHAMIVQPFDTNTEYTFAFADLWNSIYAGQKGKQWEDDPEVWVLTFEVVK